MPLHSRSRSLIQFSHLLAAFLWLTAPSWAATQAADPEKGAQNFAACVACHSLQPDRHMTGPSLAAIFGRKAGSLADFDRYSPALKHSDVVWDAGTLDSWLKAPAQFIPNNAMTFPGIADAAARADLIAFLGQPPAAQRSLVEARDRSAGMGAMSSERRDLKKLDAGFQVRSIRLCRDTYRVTTADGRQKELWEPNLRFITDGGDLGPGRGAPVILPAGMMGDRASLYVAAPEEISPLVERRC